MYTTELDKKENKDAIKIIGAFGEHWNAVCVAHYEYKK